MLRNFARYLLISGCALSFAAPPVAWAEEFVCPVVNSETVNQLEQKSFPVSGKACTIVSQSVKKSGPPHFSGLASDPDLCTAKNGKINKARVVLDGAVNAPTWTDEASTPAYHKAFIKTYLAMLKAHEERHAAIFKKYYVNIHTKLLGKTLDEATAFMKKVRCDEAKEHYALDMKEGQAVVKEGAPDTCTQIVSGFARPEYLAACQ